jgi:UDP-N-acetylglucosamine 2-epimerase (non-hydrolysing)/GDP/UDP-N,N'-diacetylbacillosamine 2-epimerase (hydrolysing)
LAALQLFDAMAGNSSSGVIEAALVGIPVLNIGDRQAGRLRFGVVHDVAATQEEMKDPLEVLLLEGQRRHKMEHTARKAKTPTTLITDWLRAEDWRSEKNKIGSKTPSRDNYYHDYSERQYKSQ